MKYLRKSSDLRYFVRIAIVRKLFRATIKQSSNRKIWRKHRLIKKILRSAQNDEYTLYPLRPLRRCGEKSIRITRTTAKNPQNSYRFDRSLRKAGWSCRCLALKSDHRPSGLAWERRLSGRIEGYGRRRFLRWRSSLWLSFCLWKFWLIKSWPMRQNLTPPSRYR